MQITLNQLCLNIFKFSQSYLKVNRQWSFGQTVKDASKCETLMLRLCYKNNLY